MITFAEDDAMFVTRKLMLGLIAWMLMTYQPLPGGDDRNENVELSIGAISGAISGFLLAWMEAGLRPAPPHAAKLLLTMLNLEKDAFVEQSASRVGSNL